MSSTKPASLAQNLYNQVLSDDLGGPVYQRTYYTHVGAPRSMGVRLKYTFD